MKSATQILKGNRILFPEGIGPGAIVISGTKIIEIFRTKSLNTIENAKDLGDSILAPGLIDCHVHINEPGRTDWEGFDTATQAAAAGGITTLIEMPLNASPVTTSTPNFHFKLRAATGKIHVNCGFWGGVVPDNLHHLEELLDQGVFGLKAFLTHSGIDDFPNTNEDHLRHALKVLKKYDRPLLVHCELDSPHPDADQLLRNPTSYLAYLKSRPKEWENKAIELMIRLCRETGGRVHIVHLSSAEALPAIRAAKEEGLPLTVETCPQYLFFTAEEIPDGDTTFKCAPPIREKANNELLWEALRDGTIDFIATDHSPAPPEIKELESGNFQKAWGGIAGLQFLLPSVWTPASERGFTEEKVLNLLTSRVAEFVGLQNSKGKIAEGFDADLIVWNPKMRYELDKSMIRHRHKATPYEGKTFAGMVEQTYVQGTRVFDSGRILHLGAGKILLAHAK